MNIVHLIDCMEHMKGVPQGYYDLAIIDPPYRNPEDNQPTRDMRRSGSLESFGGKPDQSYFDELFRISKNQIIWGANNFPELPAYKGFVVWRKLTISEVFTMSMAELAFISEGLGTVSKVFEAPPQGTKDDPRIHPTQKPVALYKWLLQTYAKEGFSIFDSHVGSGSIRIACYDMGFNFEGCEIDNKYWEAQEDRFQEHISQGLLFEPSEMVGIGQGELL